MQEGLGVGNLELVDEFVDGGAPEGGESKLEQFCLKGAPQ